MLTSKDLRCFGRVSGFILLGLFGCAGAFNPPLFSFLNGANILFHEAGHLFFSFLGEYWQVWGGTLLQLLIPFGIAAGFWNKKQPLSAAVMIWWFGQNFFMTSVYIKDSRAQVLPIIGGEGHDWAYILGKHGFLEYDQQASNLAWTAGLLVMLAAVIYGIMTALKDKNRL